MTTKDKEELATSIVKQSILRSEFLSQFISENDKEPTWDGFVYIYNNKKKRKRDFVGRVPVQIKGITVADINVETTTFSMSIEDLNNYYYDGGAILFVVLMSLDGIQTRIFYETLTPVKLSNILISCKEQTYKSVTLRRFPEDSNHKSTVFLQFHTDCKKQSSFKAEDMLRIEDEETQKSISEINITVSGFGYSPDQQGIALLENEIYLYGKQKGSDISIPFAITPTGIHLSQKQSLDISVCGTVYYDLLTRVVSQENTTCYIGKSFSIITENVKGPFKFNFTLTSSLRNAIIDLEFILAAIKEKGFQLAGAFIPFVPTEEEIKKFNIPKIEEQLVVFKKMLSALEALGISKDLNWKTLTDKDREVLSYLITAFVDMEPITGLRVNLPTVLKLALQKISIIVALEKVDGSEGTYILSDYFKSGLAAIYRDDEGKELITSKYSFLGVDDYCELDNIDYESVVQSYRVLIMENPDIVIRANNDMLVILTAYDKSRNPKLIKLAEEMSNWLNSEAGQKLGTDILTLNSLQIAKRTRDLSAQEIQELCTLIDTSDKIDVKIGACLLTGNIHMAKYYFDQLEPEIQEWFKQYPIFIFFDSAS